MTRKQTLEVNSDLTALPQVLSWFDQLYQPAIPKATWVQCQIALAEGFTNAVRHAHRDQPASTPVEIEVSFYPCYFAIRIWDQGPPFDLNQKFKDLTNQIDTTSSGGRGLQIIQRVADEVGYSRTDDGRNCLVMIKYKALTD